MDAGFNLNGIAAAEDGHRLIVAHTGRGALYSVDPDNGTNRLIDLTDSSGAPATLPNVDGIVIRDDTLWAVQNFLNQVSRIDLNGSVRRGEVEEVITSRNFDVPTTAALFGRTLAAGQREIRHTGNQLRGGPRPGLFRRLRPGLGGGGQRA